MSSVIFPQELQVILFLFIVVTHSRLKTETTVHPETVLQAIKEPGGMWPVMLLT